MTLLKEYYSVAMLICWYTMSSDCLSTMLDNLCWFLSSAFSQFSSIAFILRGLFFLPFSGWIVLIWFGC